MPGLTLLFQAIAISLDLCNTCMMQDTIEHGDARCCVAEGLIPLCERQIAD